MRWTLTAARAGGPRAHAGLTRLGGHPHDARTPASGASTASGATRPSTSPATGAPNPGRARLGRGADGRRRCTPGCPTGSAESARARGCSSRARTRSRPRSGSRSPATARRRACRSWRWRRVAHTTVTEQPDGAYILDADRRDGADAGHGLGDRSGGRHGRLQAGRRAARCRTVPGGNAGANVSPKGSVFISSTFVGRRASSSSTASPAARRARARRSRAAAAGPFETVADPGRRAGDAAPRSRRPLRSRCARPSSSAPASA